MILCDHTLWHIVTIIPATDWYALMGTNLRTEALPLLSWALIEQQVSRDIDQALAVPFSSPMGAAGLADGRVVRRVVGLIARNDNLQWEPTKGLQVSAAEEHDSFNRYIHQEERERAAAV